MARSFWADGDHGRKTDCRIHGIPSADPVPEPEHVRGVNAESFDLFGIGRNGYEMPADGLPILQGAQQPFAGRVRVGHGFKRSEGLGRNDKKSLFGAEVGVLSAKSAPFTLETNRKFISRKL